MRYKMYHYFDIPWKCNILFLLKRMMTPCRGRWLYPAEIIDLLKGLIIVVCVYMMTYIDTSMMYHLIKSQSVIKLYLFYNMLEVSTIILLKYESSPTLKNRRFIFMMFYLIIWRWAIAYFLLSGKTPLMLCFGLQLNQRVENGSILGSCLIFCSPLDMW